MADPTLDPTFLNNVWFTFKSKFDIFIKQNLPSVNVTITLNNIDDIETPLQIFINNKRFIPSNMNFGFLNHMIQNTDVLGVGAFIFKSKKFIDNNFPQSELNKVPLSKQDKIKAKDILFQAIEEASNEVRLNFLSKTNQSVIAKATVINSQTGKPIKATIR